MSEFNSTQDWLSFLQNTVKTTFEEETNGQKTINFSEKEGLMLTAILNSFAVSLFSIQNMITNKFIPQTFPQSANEDYLINYWANLFKMNQRQNTEANGYVFFQGTLTASVPAGTEVYFDSNNYITEDLQYIESFTIPYVSLTEQQGKIIVKLSQDFLLANGLIMKSIDGGYIANNIKIEATSTDTFMFDKVEGIDITAQEGNVTFEFAKAFVTSKDRGSDQNLPNGTELQILNPISNINNTVLVSYDGIINGADEETIEQFRQRILEIYQNVLQGWTEPTIKYLIRMYNSGIYFNDFIYIPRAQNIDGTTAPGNTTIYLLKNNLTFFSNTEKEILLNFLISPDTGVFPIKDTTHSVQIINPVKKIINLKIKLINNYSTLDMREAVKNSLKDFQYNQDYCWFNKNISIEDIKDFIKQTIDNNGIILGNNFILNTPIEDIVLSYNEFPIIEVEVE